MGGEKDSIISGFLELEPAADGIDISGYIGQDKNNRFFIKGSVKKDGLSQFRVTGKAGHIDVEVEKKNEKLEIRSKIKHIDFNGTDLIADANAFLEFDKQGFNEGRVEFKNVIIDYRPFNKDFEFLLNYDESRNLLNIKSFKVGSEIEGYGYINPSEPYYTFLLWRVTDLPLEEYFTSGEYAGNISGIMNGNFSLRGPIKEVGFLAHFDVQKGKIIDLKFDSLIANLKGKGPRISIIDSRICQDEGYIVLGGEIDFSKMKEGKAFDSILYGPGDNSFMWGGWNVMKLKKDSSIKAEKFLDDELFRVSFESRAENMDSMDAQEEHFLGVEHKAKF